MIKTNENEDNSFKVPNFIFDNVYKHLSNEVKELITILIRFTIGINKKGDYFILKNN